MALSSFLIDAIAKNLPRTPFRVLSFGYPIALYTKSQMELFFGCTMPDSVLLDVHSADKARHIHGNSTQDLCDLGQVFEHLGGELVTLDLKAHYGKETVLHDLNYPVSADLGEFDLSIDPGTIEHVFMAGQALISLYERTKVGGLIAHETAPVAPNHGLWNPQEKLWLRFYQGNGCRIIHAKQRPRGELHELTDLTEVRAFRAMIPENRASILVEKKTNGIRIPTDV